MTEEWRFFLYYPLGLLPSVFFTLRFVIQWLQSEKRKTSYVDKIFWQLSITGNMLLAAHYFIQLQYIFLIIQVGNAAIAWRNLNLEQTGKVPFTLRKTLLVFLLSFVLVSAGFFLQVYFLADGQTFLDVPVTMKTKAEIPMVWHFVGIIGSFLFASRFWIQWWSAEKHQKSQLDKNFWLLSIFGSVISLAFFLRVHDFVSVINYSFGLIPYIRNLVLIRKQART